MIRILLADDQAIVRDGLAAILSLVDDFDVVAQAANGAEALESALLHQPDVVLMDLRMPAKDGPTATAELLASLPETAVVALTTYADDDSIAAALAAGARGYLTKDVGQAELVAAIRSAHAGQMIFSRPVGALLAKQFQPTRTRPTQERFPELTAREVEVLDHIAQGQSNSEIASTLVLSISTVKSHVNAIFAKLNARDRAQVIARYNSAD